MAERKFQDGHYWVQLAADGHPEVALHRGGQWQVHSADGPVRTGSFHRIGRRLVTPADAFEEEIEADGDIGI